MNNIHYIITVLLILIYLLITFSISSYEKISDWNGNINFLKNHFKDSILKNHISILLLVLLIIELIASLFIIVSFFQIIIYNNFNYAMYGVELCSVSIIFMLIGQRLAKDYNGASSLTVYFILTILALFLLNK